MELKANSSGALSNKYYLSEMVMLSGGQDGINTK
jgi:hypothetical protein